MVLNYQPIHDKLFTHQNITPNYWLSKMYIKKAVREQDIGKIEKNIDKALHWADTGDAYAVLGLKYEERGLWREALAVYHRAEHDIRILEARSEFAGSFSHEDFSEYAKRVVAPPAEKFEARDMTPPVKHVREVKEVKNRAFIPALVLAGGLAGAIIGSYFNKPSVNNNLAPKTTITTTAPAPTVVEPVESYQDQSYIVKAGDELLKIVKEKYSDQIHSRQDLIRLNNREARANRLNEYSDTIAVIDGEVTDGPDGILGDEINSGTVLTLHNLKVKSPYVAPTPAPTVPPASETGKGLTESHPGKSYTLVGALIGALFGGIIGWASTRKKEEYQIIDHHEEVEDAGLEYDSPGLSRDEVRTIFGKDGPVEDNLPREENVRVNEPPVVEKHVRYEPINETTRQDPFTVEYNSGLTPRRIAKNHHLDLGEVYRSLAKEKREGSFVSKWDKNIAKEAGDLDSVERIIGSSMPTRRAKEEIKALGYSISVSTINKYRRKSKPGDNVRSTEHANQLSLSF